MMNSATCGIRPAGPVALRCAQRPRPASGAAIRGRHRPACSCPWTSSSACQSSAMASPPPREQGVHAAGVDDWLHRVGLAPGKGLRQRASTKGIRHALARHPCRDDGAMLRHRQFATNQQVSVMHPVPVHKLLQCCCRTTTRP